MPPPSADPPQQRRARARLVADLVDQGCPPRIARALLALPRHPFVPEDSSRAAYLDSSLPIGAGQTISQPQVVATMLGFLDPAPGERCLDVGAGSGYVTALLARLVGRRGEVVAIERQPALIAGAAEALARWAPRARLLLADGLEPPVEGAFDVVHVGAACERVPAALLTRLRPGARMVAPIGPHGAGQELIGWRCDAAGLLREMRLGAVIFVPALPGVAPG